VTAANAICFEHQLHGIRKRHAIQRHRLPFFEPDGDDLRLDDDVLPPRRHAHDRLDDLDALIEMLEIFRFVRRAENVRIRRVRLFGAHLVRKAGAPHVLGHLRAAAELVDEQLIEPWLVNAQVRVCEQTVPVKPLDVVALERAPVAPDVDVVLLHRDDEHRAGDGAANGRGVEVGNASG
jgi:hypothetical protein